MTANSREKRIIRRLIVHYLGGYKNVNTDARKCIDKKYKVIPIGFKVPYDEAVKFQLAMKDVEISPMCNPLEVLKYSKKKVYKWNPKMHYFYKH